MRIFLKLNLSFHVDIPLQTFVTHLTLWVVLFFLFVDEGRSQSSDEGRIHIQWADSMRSFIQDGARVNRLLGNVRLTDRDRSFSGDSAYHFPDTDRLKAWGNIEITGSNERIWTDILTYSSDDDTAILSGNVVIKRDTLTLFSTEARYSFDDEIARFPVPLQLYDGTTFLSATSGIYFSIPDSVAFEGDVQLSDSTSYSEGDHLIYRRKTGEYWFTGNVFAENRADSLKISAHSVFGDSTGYRKIDGNALIEKAGVKTDTTFTYGDLVEYFRKDGDTYELRAIGQTWIWNLNHAARADTLVYTEDPDQLLLRGNTVIWREDLQLTAGEQSLFFTSGEIDSLHAKQAPFAALQDSATSRIHQLKGDRLSAYFQNTELLQIRIPENAEVLFFLSDSTNAPQGAIQTRMREIILFFEDGELADVKGTGHSEGAAYEEDQQPETLRLDGMRWEPENKPERPPVRPAPRFEKPDPDERIILLPRRYLIYLESIRQQP